MNKTLFKTYVIYFTSLLLFVGVRIASNLGAFNFMTNSIVRNDVATIIIQIGIMILVPMLLSFLLLKQKPKEQLKTCHFKKISCKAVLISFGIGILLFFLNLIVANFFSNLIHLFGYSSGGSSSSGGSTVEISPVVLFLLEVVFTAILPGFCEEFMHRGVLMRNVASQTNYKTAIIISSVCFGLMHLNIEQVFYASILGLIIGYVGAVSDSIYPCMILHFCNNFLSVYFSYASSQNWLGGGLFDKINAIYSNNSVIFAFLFTAIIFVALVVGIGYLIVQLFKETRMKKLQKSLLAVQQEVSGDLQSQSPEQLATDFKSLIMPHLEKNQDVLSVMLPAPASEKTKQSLSTNLFLYATLFLGVLITIFTFIWGVI